MCEIVIATTNPNKKLEIETLCKDLLKPLSFRSLEDFPTMEAPSEDKPFFLDNALIKAIYYQKKLNQVVLSDDSGLTIPSLGGSPGVLSARYAGAHASAKQNYEKVLLEMENIQDRFAYFTTAFVLFDGKSPIYGIGNLYGSITHQPNQPEKGFGYEPIFYLPEHKNTLNTLSLEQKSALSHRKKAFEQLLTRVKD